MLFMGPNNAGKSTLNHLSTRLLPQKICDGTNQLPVDASYNPKSLLEELKTPRFAIRVDPVWDEDVKDMDKVIDSHWEETIKKNMKSKKSQFDMLQSSSILVHQGELQITDFVSVSVLTKSLVCLFEKSQFHENMDDLKKQVTSNSVQFSSIFRIFLQQVTITKWIHLIWDFLF